MVFTEGNRTYLVATTSTSLYLLDAASLGGADHKTPLMATLPAANVHWSAETVTTWRDPSGTRWLLGAVSSAIAAFKLIEVNDTPALQPMWTSRNLAAPRTPIVVNGVVFALSGGHNMDVGANAVLYAMDPATGKDVWNSGNAITSYASAGLSAGTGQVYVVTHDNTVWAFGIPLAIN